MSSRISCTLSCSPSTLLSGTSVPSSSDVALLDADISRILSDPLGLGKHSPELIHKMTQLYDKLITVVRQYISDVNGLRDTIDTMYNDGTAAIYERQRAELISIYDAILQMASTMQTMLDTEFGNVKSIASDVLSGSAVEQIKKICNEMVDKTRTFTVDSRQKLNTTIPIINAINAESEKVAANPDDYLQSVIDRVKSRFAESDRRFAESDRRFAANRVFLAEIRAKHNLPVRTTPYTEEEKARTKAKVAAIKAQYADEIKARLAAKRNNGAQ